MCRPAPGSRRPPPGSRRPTRPPLRWLPVVEDRQRDQLQQCVEEVRGLAERFTAAGHRLFLVGGVVRDLLLGRGAQEDLDLTTDARPEKIKELVSDLADHMWTQGERFGTVGCRIAGRDLEITTHRGEAYDPESRKPVVEFGDSVEVDLSRRDFTVNAIAVEVPGGVVVDPHGGRQDLATGVLRTPLDPHISFSDDPLRMLRAARFAAALDLAPTTALEAAVDEMAPRLEIVSAERIRDELHKLLLLRDPTAGLEFIAAHGLAAEALPEMIGEGMEDRISAAATLNPDPVARLILLLSHTGALQSRLEGLRHSNAELARAARIERARDRARVAARDRSDRSLRSLVAEAGSDLDVVIDIESRLGNLDGTSLRRAVEELWSGEDLGDLGPPIDGTAVMRLLGIEAGPDVGEALAVLREARLESGPLSVAEAETLLRRWWAGRP